MAFTPEIKNFAKNTIIFTLVFTIIIHFSWEYFASMMGYNAKAHNEANFENANIVYVWNSATALSLRLGGISSSTSTSSDLFSRSDSTISIAEVLSSPTSGQEKLIASNMVAITAYTNVVKTDILSMINSAPNRAAALDNHISLLKSYYTKTQERLAIISEQKAELKELLSRSKADQDAAKGTLQKSYNQLDYTGVDGAINDFLVAKNLDSRTRIYMIYLERFEKSYIALQDKNKKILDAIINNRDGIIKQSIVVIPDTGTDIVKELWLIQSEADYKAKQALQ